MSWGSGYRPYVPVAQRRANALREVHRLAKKGRQVSPVEIAGRMIASTFWGKAWCDNLESYSDFSNRLRGRTYVRNGSVVDLQIEPDKVKSMVGGSMLYRVAIYIRPLAAPRWKRLKQQCGAQIGSVVELLQGRLSTSVMAIVTSRDSGLFPAPAEIKMSFSCPGWAGMCKHVAATLYGVGSRLDHSPELLFKLRQVDHLELISEVGCPTADRKAAGRKTITKDQFAGVFGIELETDGGTTKSASMQPARRNGREMTRSEKTFVPESRGGGSQRHKGSGGKPFGRNNCRRAAMGTCSLWHLPEKPRRSHPHNPYAANPHARFALFKPLRNRFQQHEHTEKLVMLSSCLPTASAPCRGTTAPPALFCPRRSH